MAEMQPVEQPAAGENRPAAFISERHRNPGDLAPVKAVGRDSWAGIVAIVALLVFAALVAFLYFDWSTIQNA